MIRCEDDYAIAASGRVLIFGAGVLVGWLLLGGGSVDAKDVDVVAVGTLATAVGTVFLGAATVFLGVKTGDVVDASEREAQAAREELGVAREQLSVANATLDSQTEPFLTVGDASPSLLNAASVHVRNVGNATAIVTTAVFIYGADDLVSAAAVSPAIPAKEGSSIRLPEGARPEEKPDNFSVAVIYSDVSGRARGVVRLDVYKRQAEPLPACIRAAGDMARPPSLLGRHPRGCPR